MRALYLQEIPSEDKIELKGDELHHLIQVVRVKAGEELLLLNGRGMRVLGRIEAVGKKNLLLQVLKRDLDSKTSPYDLALVVPKKEALELCLKQATELGFGRIYLVRGHYSQIKIPDSDRLMKILISGLEQSNAAYLPEVLEVKLTEINWGEYGRVLWLDSQSSENKNKSHHSIDKNLLVVGPEAGFSPEEREILSAINNLEQVNLPTPILRSPTAVATGAGLLLERLLDKKRYETLESTRIK